LLVPEEDVPRQSTSLPRGGQLGAEWEQSATVTATMNGAAETSFLIDIYGATCISMKNRHQISCVQPTDGPIVKKA
jgi:hypothetical protein